MPTLTAAEIVTLRGQRPKTARVSWYLALAPYGDATFTALVNDAGIAKGERDIVYDADVGEANVQAGMTLWIGTVAGAYDVGRVRIRNINVGANTITVAENDDILWADDLFLTCPGEAGFRELWGVYPRIAEAGGVVTFYEDYDDLYVNPIDDVLPPKANAGPPVCVFLGAGGFVDVSFTGDESFTPEIGAAIATYLWDFSDGVVQSGSANAAGTCAVPNVVRFTTPGFRYLSLTVTDNTGVARNGIVYIPVWIFNRTTAAPLSVQVQAQTADPEWKLTLKAFSTETNLEDVFYNYPDGALCVLFSETIYPDGSTDLGGFCHRENIRFVGWLDAESLSFDYDSGTIDFNAISSDLRLKELPGFAYTLEDDNTPSDWFEVNDLNIDRALHAHLERKSTTNQICHVERLNESSRTISIQAFPDASIYDQAQEHLLKDAMVTMLADRQGVLRVRRDPQFMDAADRNTVDVVVALTVADTLDDIDETRQHQDELGYVRLGGFAYETPLLSEAPGVAPSQSEAASYVEGFLAEDQAELNLWAWLWWEKANNDYKDVPLEMLGYWPVFDPAFQEYIRLTATDSLGRNVWASQRFVVRRVTFDDMVGDGTGVVNLVVEKETDLGLGETVTIPIPPPPEHPPPPPPVTPITIPTPDFALVHDRHQVYSTPDFNALNPTWTNITGALVGSIFAVECDHFDGVGAWACTGTWNTDANDVAVDVGLWRTDDVTVGAPVWTLVFQQAQGDANRMIWRTDGDGNPGCDGLTPEPQWGQLRSIHPSAAGMCLVAEHRWHGLAAGIKGATDIWEVDSVGGFTEASGQVLWYPGIIGWGYGCGDCSDDAGGNPGAKFFAISMLCNQSDKRGCRQVFRHSSGSVCIAGLFSEYFIDLFCDNPAGCDCAGCLSSLIWPRRRRVLGAPCVNHQNGATHVIWYEGTLWGQSQQAAAGGAQAGAVYNGIDGEVDTALWDTYAFCNMASHYNHIYWGKEINAVVNRANELRMDNASVSVTSDLLFGGNGPGYLAGIIGHIRAIWDEDQTVVLVKKNQPEPAQPNTDVVYTYDPTNGLANKTGNLSGVTWRGTGHQVPPAGWDQRWDNVGFSAFGVPLR